MKPLTKEQEFLLQLKDPEAFELIVKGIRRARQYYNIIHDVSYFEVPRPYSNMRSWRVVFKLEFRPHQSIVHVADNIRNDFRQGNPDIHVTIPSFSNQAKTIIVYVTRGNRND